MSRERSRLRRLSRWAAIVGATALAAAALAGCTAPPVLVKGTTVTVAATQPFFSTNPKTSYGNATPNATVVDATSSNFASYDNVPQLQKDDSFGSYQVVSQDPFTVKYTVDPGVRWSDGTPVDAADLLLAWAANSGTLNTKGFDAAKYADPQTGEYTTRFPAGTVYFDGFSGDGLQLVTKTPTIGDDGRSLTLVYDHYFVDWQLVFGVGMPAHVVAEKALGVSGATKAKKALIAAVQDRDTAALAKLSWFWDTGYNFTSMPKDRSLLVSDGPYTLTDFAAGDHVTLTANPRYTGDHRPKFERVVIRYITDPLAAVHAFTSGAVDVVSPQPTQDVVKALLAAKGATVIGGFDGAWEHLDLQFAHSRSGVFDDPRVRRAFLKTVPRQRILEQLITPVQEEAKLRDSQVFLPGSEGYADSVKGNGSQAYDRVDIAGAKSLLAHAGVANPQVCILFDPSNPRRVAEFGMIQKSAALAGFTVTDCSSTDWLQLLGTRGAYDASLYALRPTSLAVTSVAASFSSDSTINNLNFYSDPTVDRLIGQLDATSDHAQQLALLKRIDALVWGDAYGLPLYQFPAVTAVDRRVKGVAPSPLTPGPLWNVWAWEPVESH